MRLHGWKENEIALKLKNIILAHKILALVTLLTVLALSELGGLTGMFMNNSRAKNVVINYEVKDYPRHGISIITSSNPLFDELANAYQQRNPGAPIEALKPMSIVIRNRSNKTIVGYKLIWEGVKPDGTITTTVAAHTTMWALTSLVTPHNVNDVLAKSRAVIRPNADLFFSLAAPPTLLDDPRTESFQLDAQGEENLRELNADFRGYASVRVVLDGMFFDDGTFVGQDSTAYFAKVKSQVEAKRDLLQEVEARVRAGKPLNEVFSMVEQADSEQGIEIYPDSTPEESYRYYKKVFAREILATKKKSDRKAIELVRAQLRNPWVKLQKLPTD